MFNQLKAQFPPDAISWRAQSVNKDGTKALALAYIDARDVMNRLDDVCTPAGWQDSYAETANGRILCTLKIRVGDEWLSKSDGAGNTDVEGDKGALSDALKRAAVKWGIGRYLYDFDSPWVACESYEAGGKKRWSKWTPEGMARLTQIAQAVYKGAEPPKTPDKPEPRSQPLQGPIKTRTSLRIACGNFVRELEGCADLDMLDTFLASEKPLIDQVQTEAEAWWLGDGADFLGMDKEIKRRRLLLEMEA